MLHAKGLDRSFWADAQQTALYVRNRVASSALPTSTTPYHRCHDTAPDVSHCPVFRSESFYVVPRSKVKKLDPRSRQAIFIGYLENGKGYTLADVANGKGIMSRDVTFQEAPSVPATSVALETSEPEPLDRGGDTKVRFKVDEDDVPAPHPEPVVAQDTDFHDCSDSQPDSTHEAHDTPDEGTPARQNVEPSTKGPPEEDTAEGVSEGSHASQSHRRSTRNRKAPSTGWKTSANIALSARVGPVSYKAPTNSPNAADFWTPGIQKEHD